MANFIVAVTGGIASGKSAVTDFFKDLGIAVADADIAARAVVEPGQPALHEIANYFGPTIMLDGQLDRVALRKLIFENADAKSKLESITHPRIRDLLIKQCKEAKSPYAIVAIPLLAEANNSNYAWLGRTVVVDVPIEIQKSRLLARDKISEALADKMLEAQASRSQRLAIANDVVTNIYDKQSLKESVQRLDMRYRKLD